MKKIGYLLITIGFLAGSLTAVTDKVMVNWNYFLLALAVGIIGIVMVRLFDRRHYRSEERLTGHLSDIKNSLSGIVNNITALCDAEDMDDPYQVHKKIDELFNEDIITFVDARTAIGSVYGLQQYADIMSYFASAERALNRAWSASTDGYINEVKNSLQKAKKHFSIVLEKVNQLKQQVV